MPSCRDDRTVALNIYGHCVTLGVARLTSPGRCDQLPPPTRETMEAWWCGARKGGRSVSSPSGNAQPADEWMRVTVSTSAGVSGGSSPTSRSASIVFPEPGGPTMRRW